MLTRNDAGQAYVTPNLINTIMRGPDWDSTAIFLTWDDWGGFYDNVVPPQVDDRTIRPPSAVAGDQPVRQEGGIDHQVLSFDAYNASSSRMTSSAASGSTR